MTKTEFYNKYSHRVDAPDEQFRRDLESVIEGEKLNAQKILTELQQLKKADMDYLSETKDMKLTHFEKYMRGLYHGRHDGVKFAIQLMEREVE